MISQIRPISEFRQSIVGIQKLGGFGKSQWKMALLLLLIIHRLPFFFNVGSFPAPWSHGQISFQFRVWVSSSKPNSDNGKRQNREFRDADGKRQNWFWRGPDIDNASRKTVAGDLFSIGTTVSSRIEEHSNRRTLHENFSRTLLKYAVKNSNK